LLFENLSFLEVTLSSLCIKLCKESSASATITWLSANKNVLKSLFLESLILFSYLFPFCNNMIYIC
jgi:hypothetical protein